MDIYLQTGEIYFIETFSLSLIDRVLWQRQVVEAGGLHSPVPPGPSLEQLRAAFAEGYVFHQMFEDFPFSSSTMFLFVVSS